MSAMRALARRYGLKVRLSDLGDWTTCELRSEYDARLHEIRLNRRVAARLRGEELRAFIEQAVAHELYHHREAIGEISTLPTRAQRETAANLYARDVVARR